MGKGQRWRIKFIKSLQGRDIAQSEPEGRRQIQKQHVLTHPPELSVPTDREAPWPAHMEGGEAEASACGPWELRHFLLRRLLPGAAQWPRRALPPAPVDR